jgi:hypothetical protein
MPYKNPKDRPYKEEYKKQVARGELPDRMERQRARRAMDAKGIDRTGMDVSHNKALAKGGSNKDGYKLESPSANRSRNLHKKGEKKG